ncbi:hypothetical protein D3C81_2176130 [compost metagenome]
MQGRDEGGQLWFSDVLKIIDKDHYGRPCMPRRFTNMSQQGGKIPFEIAVVGQPRLGFVIEIHLNILVASFQ